jgi:cell division transport system permease protein
MFIPLKRVISYGFKNFKRQSSLNFATIFILVIAITLLTSLILFKGAINYLVSEIQKKIDVSIYLRAEAPLEEIEKIKDELSGLPEIESIEYVSSQEAMRKFRERHKDDPLILESLEMVGENPFYPSLNIKASSPNQYTAILAFLDRESFKDIVYKVDYAKKKTLIEKLFSITSNLNLIGLILSSFLGAIAILVTFNTVRVTIKDSSEEISIMRLVGASNWYIRGPFIVQGIICGSLAAITTFLIFFLICYFSAPKIVAITGGFNIFAWFGANAAGLFFLQLASGVGLGVISSLIAIRRFLRA